VKVFGTIAGAAPDTPIAATKFGQAGVGTITSSPVPATMRTQVWTACMPDCVTKNRSGENGRPNRLE
jgi:hypothetical protein